MAKPKNTNEKNAAKSIRHATYTLSGRITDQNDKPLRGLIVSGFDWDPSEKREDDKFSQSSVTDKDGNYTITFQEEEFVKDGKESGGPDVYIRVYKGGIEVGSSIEQVQRNVQEPVVSVNLKIPYSPSEGGESLPNSVQGKVTLSSGEAVVGYRVRAYLREMGAVELHLGEMLVNPDDGRYAIHFYPSEYRKSDKGIVTLSAAVVDPEGNELPPFARSYDAIPENAEINLNIAAPVDERSEFDRYMIVVQEAIGNVQLSDLHGKDTELDTIAEVKQIDRQHLGWLALAAHYATLPANALAPIPDEKNDNANSQADALLLHAAFYGWLRVELNEPWSSIGDAAITELKTAIEQRIIPNILDGQQTEQRLRQWIVTNQQEHILQSPALGTPTRLNELLGTMPTPLTEVQRRVLAGGIADLRPEDPDLVSRIKELDKFGEQAAIQVAHTLRLSALTGGNVGLIGALQTRLENETEGTLRPLTQLRRDQLINLAYTHRAQTDTTVTPVAYAKALEEAVERLHPTAALAAHLSPGRRLANQTDLTVVGEFLNANPDFDLVSADLNSLSQQKNVGNTEIKPELVDSIRTLKRMNMGGVTWGETAVFMEHGIRSLTQIADAGPGQLKELLGEQISPERLEELSANVENMRANAIAAYTAIMSPLSAPAIMAGGFTIADSAEGVLQTAIVPQNALMFRANTGSAMTGGGSIGEQSGSLEAERPTLPLLFGSQDDCACGHCQSVLSPAAYYVDLLQFAKNANLLEPLLERRPDLAHIELSCENTNTVAPAIDLILETLENAIALPYKDPDFPRNEANVDTLFSTNPLPDIIRNSLKKTAKSVSPILSASGTSPNWVVVDDHKRWELNAQSAAIEITGANRRKSSHNELIRFIPEFNEKKFSDESKPLFARIFYPDVRSQIGGTPQSQGIPDFDNYMAAFVPNAGKDQWSIQFRFEVHFEIDIQNGTLNLYTPNSLNNKSWWDEPRRFDQLLLEQLQAELQQQQIGEVLFILIADRFPFWKGLRVVQFDSKTSRWIIATPDVTIDLVLVPSSLTITALAYQSGDVDFDALAEPENQNPEAYRILSDPNNPVVFPWTLPFNLHLDELRLYLERARTSRRKLLEVMQPPAKPINDNPIFVREVLGLNKAEAEIITTKYTNRKAFLKFVYESWGIKPGERTIFDASLGIHIPMRNSTLEVLQNVSILLQQSRMSFEELQAVLKTEFVKRGEVMVLLESESTCKPSDMNLGSLTLNHLDRIHRFVRLQRRLGWSIDELDAAIKATRKPEGIIDLRELANLVQLHELLNLPILTICNWWNTVNSDEARQLLLARALGATVNEVVHAIDLIKGLPSTPSDPFTSAETLYKFCKRFRNIQKSGISFLDLRYLLKHEQLEAEVSDTILRDEQLATLANAIREGLKSQKDLLDLVLPPLPTSLSNKVSEIQKRINNRLVEFPRALATLPTFIEKLSTEYVPIPAGHAAARAAELVRAELVRWIETTISKQLALETVVSSILVTQLGVGREMIETLLLVALSDLATPAIEVFRDSWFTSNGKQQIPEPAKALLTRLQKSVVICSALNLSSTDLSLLQRQSSAPNARVFTVLDFQNLPLSPTADSSHLLGFEQLLALANLRNLAPGMGKLLHQLADSKLSNLDKMYELLGDNIGLSSNQVEEAMKRLAITATSPIDLRRDPINLTNLFELLIALKQLGATVAQAKQLINDVPDPQDAATANSLLRQKYSERAWRDIIKPISDALRERQRDMLVDYLVHKEKLRDASDLYEYFLIDVELSSCFKTTRLLMATAAVQLYMQRVMLNLEGRASISPDKRKQWEWMQNYRVWEANRKVFLFPENWLLPELRDDKTEPFRQMESVLTQGEPTPEVTRNALLTYLDDLGEHAQIQVIAMYEEGGTLYVVGRTPNTPYRYFLRSCPNFGTAKMSWTGWEALELDNANDFVMPFIFEGDLHIAWPTFKKTNIGNEIADLRWEVQIAWVRRTTQGWTKRKLSQDTLTVPRLLEIAELRSFVFKVDKRTETVPMSKDLKQEVIYINCFSATEATEITVYKPDIQQIDAVAEPRSREPAAEAGGKRNVLLSLLAEVYEHYKIDGKDIYRPSKEAELNLEYLLGNWGTYSTNLRSQAAKKSRDFQNLAPNSPDKWFVTLLDTVSSTWKQNPAVFVIPLMEIINDGEFSLKAKLKNRVLKLRSSTKELDGKLYQYWLWQPTIIFEIDPPADTPYKSEREVTISSPSGSFVYNTGNDMKLMSASVASIYNPTSFRRSGNRFTNAVDNQGKLIDSNVLKFDVDLEFPIDHLYGKSLAITGTKIVYSAPSEAIQGLSNTLHGVWHVQEQVGRYYILLDSEKAQWLVWPDGNDFAGLFRNFAAATIFKLLERSTQAMVRESQPAESMSGRSTIARSISFERQLPYANYNWELFLHAPLAIAAHLATQQRFEDARKWLHTVFDPTTQDVIGNRPQFWRFLPFSNVTQPATIAELLALLSKPIDPMLEAREKAEIENAIKEIQARIEEWKNNPFMPHLIARLRPSAYQWYTFFAYLDVLIGWADHLFRRDTRESVNEATLLYVLAAKLLGPRPRTIPSPPKPEKTYRDLQVSKNGIDAFSNAWLNYAELEGFKQFRASRVDANKPNPGMQVAYFPSDPSVASLGSVSALAFCIPQNEKVTEYHNTIEERLFNVRHCRNIEGVERELPLYDPPIDPLLLIRARAAGLDLRSVLDDISAPVPHYRFTFTLQKALELCAELKSLGGALLSAIEKQDAEALSMMRSSHETAMLKLVREIRERQVAEAEANIVALEHSELTIRERFTQYQKLLGNNGVTEGEDGLPVMEQTSSLSVAEGAPGDMSGLGLIQEEVDQALRSNEAQAFTQTANSLHMTSSFVSGIPNITWGGPAPAPTFTFGGSHLSNVLGGIAKSVEMLSVNANFWANRASLLAGYQRRRDEWVHQSKLALSEMKQIKKQKLAAQIRKEIVELELKNHDTQIENAQQIESFMRSKFTNQQLYRWMSNQISQLYFRTYQLTLDQAQRAERAYQHELGLETKLKFVRQGQWDSLKRGLLAGDQLYHDLKRMESAYLANNKREFEITKHISLLQLLPSALVSLREKGECKFTLPEVLFDVDFPNHYLRRIKSVSLSIPCVTGPYASVSAKLELTSSRVRYETNPDTPENGLPKAYMSISSIVTSTGQMDSGMFETNLRDERYLPFEGAGVISDWKLSLPSEFKQFDYKTISDVVLHIRYTAREGSAEGDRANIQAQLNKPNPSDPDGKSGLIRLFSLRYEFPSEWAKFKDPKQAGDMQITLREQHFPFWTNGKKRTALQFVWRKNDRQFEEFKRLPDLTKPEVTIPLPGLDKNMDDIWILLMYQLS